VELICAIDLLDGGAVRLVQGDYDRRIPAATDAVELARRFVAAGCRRLHVVDLAGARSGRPVQLSLVEAVVAVARGEAPDCVVEATGGLRTGADVEAALRVADEVVLGTAAVEDPRFLAACAERHPGRVGASLDVRDGRSALDGWSRLGAANPHALAARLLGAGASRLVVTDTRRDGTLGGPNLEMLRGLRDAFPDAVLVAAGGVGSIDDLRALDAIGVNGAVVGLALLTGDLDVAVAVRALA
jgi:phosphoribosylformimino-5-aminoimidazole carboxamide ribotide isomerase